jgi:energy-coupling factor transporter ATP-binding protein EcfA2
VADRPFTFFVVPYGTPHPPVEANSAYLVASNWDDWFKFETQYALAIYDPAGTRHEIGALKIGCAGMVGARPPVTPETLPQRVPPLPPAFHTLPEAFFSLGQDESYYAKLNRLGGTWRDGVLLALRDVASDEELFESNLAEKVMLDSLLRYVTPTAVRGQLRRLARGGARLTPFSFAYQMHRRGGGGSAPPTLTFEVQPNSQPPSNVHVIIGRNGVGKSDLFSSMTKTLLSSTPPKFACIVSVSFSAFDSFELLPERRDASASPRFAYVGLRRTTRTGDGIGTPKSSDMLASEFVTSMRVCRDGVRQVRWRQALKSLEQDPIFHEAGVSTWGADQSLDGDKATKSLFNRLSSGHKIVLLTITRLVELVEEQTLVLIDEPEGHLHPPLLSAFIRSLSDLLVTRNGMSIIATHSPVVLQEVPRDCVWKLRRAGTECRADRPEIETFGENVGVLTREAFGLEVTRTGFHQLLADAVERGGTFEQVVAQFNNRLGAEALAIVRALVATKDERQ